MAQKFIITQKGCFRLGDVYMHRDLLREDDVCYGGGFYEYDFAGNRLLLSGMSYDFGSPQWDRLMAEGTSLKVPEAYRGMQIIYDSGARHEDALNVTAQMKVEYVYG